MKFRRKPEFVDAIQFTDVNNPPEGVQRYNYLKVEPDDTGEAFAYKVHAARWISIEVGDWIATHADGHKWVYLKEEFERKFEEVME
jgi:hypothetical protein